MRKERKRSFYYDGLVLCNYERSLAEDKFTSITVVDVRYEI